MKAVLDWLDSRTSYRWLLRHLLYEELPSGTAWLFTSGSVVTLLISCQFVTGVGLTMYYVPSPRLAFDSVRFIMSDLPLGWMLRGLHYWGASFLVVATIVHMLRVFFLGSYKAPRELTWLSGLTMLLVILGFSLSGYLLPWDQKAYWATTVTINIARGTPLIGDAVANVLRGGADLGALTLGRWYSAHVFLLPVVLVVLIVSHIALMRKHGISGPIEKQSGPLVLFYPWHVMKDTVMMAAVFASLITAAALFPAHLDEIANPTDASYIPRPEWYFLSLFQMLKYFPGPLEPVATMIIPGLAIGFLALLPFLDRADGRHPLRRPRRVFTAVIAVLGIGVIALTAIGMADRPPHKDRNDWGLLPIAGMQIATGDGNTCVRCHENGGPAAPLSITRLTKDNEWLVSHMADPVAIAPGVRNAQDPAPAPVMSRFNAQAAVAYLKRVHAGDPVPAHIDDTVKVAAQTYAETCVVCHRISGEGGILGPDLTFVGRRRPEAEIHSFIEDPEAMMGEPSAMPAFGKRLKPEQIDALAKYLASRK
ncbi:MAG TPA: cytochrome b N-terminal domain-containing protein [Vicinamibacterales bacterium]|nr:cytochrome b N-terminal domain-containing protein [Vicinamibacterales bacterium]